MNELSTHEILEIEVLEKLKNGRFLQPLVFIGGTMLRLCHELPIYSVDLDLWIEKREDNKLFFKTLNEFLADSYKITDAGDKKNTMLFELKSPGYRRALKIEIRKLESRPSPRDVEDKIAYSVHSNRQVFLKGLTLQKTLENKTNAALDRKEIRDVFDIEFILRRGIPLVLDAGKKELLLNLCGNFRKDEFTVKLGSLLPKEQREYYRTRGFSYLMEKINSV